MARREIFVDDIDGKEDETVETRRYSVGRQGYTIDLSAKNYEKMLKALEPFMAVSTKEEAPPRSVRGVRRATAPKVNDKGYSASDVREWAKAEGKEVSERGRIHKDIIEAYEYAKGLDK